MTDNLNSNVDLHELNKFAELASYWWDQEGAFKSLHDINPLRVELIEDSVDGLFGKEMLDVGCGGGILSEALAAKGAKVTGIDMVSASLEVARLHQLESGIKVDYQLSTAEEWAEKHKNHYDVVCCLEMLEHVPEPRSIVEAVSQMVKPGGRVIFSTLNRNIKAYLMAIVAAEKLLKMVPGGTHEYNKFIRPSELVRMLSDTLLVPELLTGLHFNPLLSKYFISDKNVDVNYFLICQKTG